MWKKFDTLGEANSYADRLDKKGLDPEVEQIGDHWIVISNVAHADDRYAQD